MKQWTADYIKAQKAAHDSIPVEAVAQLIEKLRAALKEDRQIFVFGNGGSAANASHFATDLGKLASDKVGKRFRVLSLNDNVGWLTALGNDYAYEDVFVGQLQNYGKAGDLVLALSVSGNSPNCVKALEWAKKTGLHTVALVGAKRGRMAEIAEQAIVINDTHYGRVEDAEMGICHMRATRLWKSRNWGGSRQTDSGIMLCLLTSAARGPPSRKGRGRAVSGLPGCAPWRRPAPADQAWPRPW